MLAAMLPRHQKHPMPKLTHHPNLSNEDYHAMSAVSPSRLKERTMLHYWDRFENPNAIKPAPTPAMQRGTALHTAVLEPETWADVVAVQPRLDRRTKAGKAAAAEFEQAAAGRVVLSADDAEEVALMADAVRSHPAAKFLLEMPGAVEQSYSWTDAATNVECKTRPDWHSADQRIVVDVKTTQDASRSGFAKSTANFGYHVQAAWNQDALGAEQFITIAVESIRPYAVAVYPASPLMITAGQRRISRALEQIAECRASGVWPGYGDQIQEPLELPGWCND